VRLGALLGHLRGICGANSKPGSMLADECMKPLGLLDRAPEHVGENRRRGPRREHVGVSEELSGVVLHAP